MRTTAVVVNEQGLDFSFEELEIDDPRPDEVLVRIVASGICHTDISLRDSLPAEMFPRVFGHEGAGVVERVGAEVTGIAVGDHVLMSLRSCRACANCRSGLVGYCDDTLMLNYMGFRMDGSTTLSRAAGPVYASFLGQSSLARHAIAYADNCVVVDPALDLATIAPFGCGFQTGAGTVLNVLRPAADDSLVVYGVGAVGLAAVAAARATGVSTVVAVDRIPGRLRIAEKYGARGLDPADLGEASMVDRVRELTGGGSTYAIDTTAMPEVVKQGTQALRMRGTMVALGLGPEEYVIDAVDLLQGGKRVMSSIEGDSDPQEMLPRLLRMRAEGTFDLDDLVTTYPFDRIDAAVADVLAGRVVKPVLVW